MVFVLHPKPALEGRLLGVDDGVLGCGGGGGGGVTGGGAVLASVGRTGRDGAILPAVPAAGLVGLIGGGTPVCAKSKLPTTREEGGRV